MTTPEVQEVNSAGMTEEQAAEAMLARWVKPEDDAPAKSREADEPQEPEAEQGEEPDAQAEDESEKPDEPESAEVEIDVGGEKFKLPPAIAEQAKRIEAKVKEIEAGTTRKFQEAAEVRKSAEAQIQTAQQMQKLAREQADLIADHRMVERRLARLEQIDINALADTDPVQLTKINAEYNQLVTAKQRIEQQFQQSIAGLESAKAEQQKARLSQLGEFAKRSIRGWSDEYSDTLLQFSVNTLGFDPSALRESLSEPLMRAIDLAYQGHKVRTADPRGKREVTTATLKPGAAQQAKSTAHQAAEKARQRLQKTGSTDDAAMALLARANLRKR